MRVRGGGRCVFGVVGPCWILLPGDRASCCWELNSLGSLTVEREVWVWYPSSAGLVKSRVNLPRPLGKPKYYLMTDSA